MDVTPLVKEGAQIIQAYADGGFRISGERYDGAVIVFPEKTILWRVAVDVKSLNEEAFADVVSQQDEIDVLLLGTGKTLVFPDPALKKALKEQGIHVEVMDSGAACRTYNVLMAEGRRVAAMILPL